MEEIFTTANGGQGYQDVDFLSFSFQDQQQTSWMLHKSHLFLAHDIQMLLYAYVEFFFGIS